MSPTGRVAPADLLTLHDEAGHAFEMKVVRGLRDGGRLFVIAERVPEGTLHPLIRERDELVLVKDRELLTRLEARLTILARALQGELIEWRGPGGAERFLGVFETVDWEGRTVLLAADLEEPETVIALERQADSLTELAAESRARLAQRMAEVADRISAAAAPLAWSLVGTRDDAVEVVDARGARTELTAVWRTVLDHRAVLFLAEREHSERVLAAWVEGERLEPITDAAVLKRLRAAMHLP